MPPHDWIDHHRSVLDWMPFASMWLGTRDTDKPLLTRAFENLLMAAAAAALAVYVNDARQDDRLTALTAQVEQLRQDLRALTLLHLNNRTP